jgi:hypothetical protein
MMFKLHLEAVIGGGHLINQSLEIIHLFLQYRIAMM